MLLDTSGLFCLLHRAELHHVAAKEHYAAAAVRITHSLILAEFVALCTVRRLPRPTVLAFVKALLSNTDIEVVWVDQSLCESAFQLLLQRPDKTYSWCDAVSFVLMAERGLDAALSTDRHFDQERLHRLLG